MSDEIWGQTKIEDCKSTCTRCGAVSFDKHCRRCTPETFSAGSEMTDKWFAEKLTNSSNSTPIATDTNPKDLLGIKKVQLNLVPAASKIYQARAMEDGAVKYGPFNWRDKKVIASIYVAAAMRHLESWYDGEEEAKDSKVHHLGHALACLGIIVDALETGNLIDDRPTPGVASALIEKLKQLKETKIE